MGDILEAKPMRRHQNWRKEKGGSSAGQEEATQVACSAAITGKRTANEPAVSRAEWSWADAADGKTGEQGS